MILHNTLSCCFEERAGSERVKGGETKSRLVCLLCPLLIHYSAFSHTTCYYGPSNQICRARENAGLLSRLPWRSKRGWAIGTPLWTSGWNNSDHSWQQRMSGWCTHIWHSAQMSFHLRRTLKGDRLHPSCQADKLAVVVVVGGGHSGGCAVKLACIAELNHTLPWLTDPKMNRYVNDT